MGKSNPIKIGDRFETKSHGSVEVVKYENCHKITVRFEDGTETIAESANIRAGEVRNRNAPSVYGVGYLSYGEFKAYINNKQTPEYRAWWSMLERCYGPRELNPTYDDCTVHKDWHNFQVFAKWYTSHKHYNKGFELDKDLTVFGNREYGPTTCDLVPRDVNLVLADCGASRRKITGIPAGVSPTRNGKYAVQHGSFYGANTKWKGTFNTLEEAKAVYKSCRESHAQNVAQKHKAVLSEQVYNNLMNYTVSVDD